MRSNNQWTAPPSPHGWTQPGKVSKSAEDYFRSLGRGWWFIVLTTLIAGGVGTWVTLNQQPIYMASSRILIEPPRAIVPDLVSDKSNAASMNFFNTRIQMIGSREITRRVLTSRELASWKETTGIEDPLSYLSGWVEAKPVLNSNLVDITLEGTEPSVVSQLVNVVVEEFMQYEEHSLREFEQLSRGKIEREVQNLKLSLEAKKKELAEFHKDHTNFLANGQSVAANRLEELEKVKTQAELRRDDARRQVERFEELRKADVPYFTPESVQKTEQVRSQLRIIDAELTAQKEAIKPEWYETDPMIKRLKTRRAEIVRSLNEVGKGDAEIELRRLKQEYSFAAMDADKIDALVNEQRKTVMGQQTEKEKLEAIKADEDRLASLADKMSISQMEIDMHQSLITPRIQVIDKATPPTSPVRPIKEVQIPLCFAGGLAFGLFVILGLEFINQRVRRAEQAATCLGLPVLGVIPRLRRRERHGRAGVIALASEQQGTRVCESFRNLRTAMIGVEANDRARSLVVSSPTSGEGKTLVAANIAATCARAGESVIVIDVDLRHPRIARAFGIDAKAPGLVESVSGSSQWQEVVHETNVPNLYVMTTGQTAGVPIDILGTVEMHDLLAELTEEFDRVIIDGPPLLGLADSRVVGRFADGVLLVVQANVHKGAPLSRVRELCDLEGLRPIGLVFNGIRYKHDDLRTLRTVAMRNKPASIPARAVPATEPEPEVAEEAIVSDEEEFTESQVA
ncbi:polysaccharide biosynthesis tyrosine autokinase [bacterium]|nr:polysaccharide biosynthesis tyrosine autokinase [bacterium]